MSLKALWLALLLAAAGLYICLDRSSTAPAVNLQPAQLSVPEETRQGLVPILDSIERRLANLEERLHGLEQVETDHAKPMTDIAELQARIAALEVQSRRGSPSQEYLKISQAPKSPGVVSTPNGPDPHMEQLRQDFENDDYPDSALQAELENAAPLFEAEQVASLTFRQVDCRANYCRLKYEDNSRNSAEATIAENELFLLLSQKYGQDIIIHGGERSGRSRSIYLEFYGIEAATP